MPDQLSYAILGRGRWSGKDPKVLAGHGRRSVSIGATRAALGEDQAAYRARLTSAMIATDAHIAWLCLPPGPHIPLIVEAAIFAGLHVIVEKPWLIPAAETARLFAMAQNAGRVVAVHYEYCFCREVESWRSQLQGGAGLQFCGRFTVDRPDRLGISAAENLGSHLLAIWQYAVPHAQVAEIHCGYELPNERRVWLEREGKRNRRDRLPVKRAGDPAIRRSIRGGLARTRLPAGSEVCCSRRRSAVRIESSRKTQKHKARTVPALLTSWCHV